MMNRTGAKDTLFSQKRTINWNGRLMDFAEPGVMGILNVTPDSFYDGSLYMDESALIERVRHMIGEGADMVDVGACSTRPGAVAVEVQEEMHRLRFAFSSIRREFPDACLSVDTYRSEAAKMAVEEFGAGLINDISAGTMDKELLPLAGRLRVPVVLMHMQGSPQTMQQNPQYADVTRDVLAYFAGRIDAARNHGVEDLLLDPGFGFGKTLEHNYRLLSELKLLTLTGLPVLVGMSRKSMLWKPLSISPAEAMNATTVVNTLALANGASILRVHDVREAVEAVRLFGIYRRCGTESD
jgi:dihydropteroate synthase